jgi:hypothetical protein
VNVNSWHQKNKVIVSSTKTVAGAIGSTLTYNYAYRDACHRWLRQAGALLGLITIFNCWIMQGVEAVGVGIKLTPESGTHVNGFVQFDSPVGPQ